MQSQLFKDLKNLFLFDWLMKNNGEVENFKGDIYCRPPVTFKTFPTFQGHYLLSGSE